MGQLGMPYTLELVPVDLGASSDLIGELIAVTLTHRKTRVRLSPADVGYGVSQVLPVLIELSLRQQSVVCIEQPEIHLHPALQANLADLLIESASDVGRANQVIVETHSEHLILRIQRRIREGSLDASQVKVLYVDQDSDGSSHVIDLKIGADGEFATEWPGGFFEERITELFGDFG
jgi:predicted ATPase